METIAQILNTITINNTLLDDKINLHDIPQLILLISQVIEHVDFEKDTSAEKNLN